MKRFVEDARVERDVRRFWWVPVIAVGIAIGVLLVVNPLGDRDGPPVAPDGTPPVTGALPDPGSAPLALRSTPWAAQGGGSPRLDQASERPSLIFPPGVTYGQALRQIVQSTRQTGQIPADATLADPLPPEVVIVRPDSPGTGIRVSLVAPFGWTPDSRLIRPASYRFPAGVDIDQAAGRLRDLARPGSPVPPDIAVDVPALEPCQIAIGTPDRRPAC